MITPPKLVELPGRASVLNIGFLVFTGMLLITMRRSIAGMHSKMFGIPEDELSLVYFKYLAHYKSLMFVFILAPYIALKIMGH